MKKLFFSLLVVTLVFALVLPGCAPTEEVTPPPAEEEEEVTPPPAEEEEEVTPPPTGPEGTLNVAMADLGGEIWPGNKSEVWVMYFSVACWEPLIRINAESEIAPCLAKSWERTEDGMTWTFHLEEGIQFHDDWGEMTAEDVKFSWEQAIAEDSQNMGSGYLRTAIAETEVIDKYTVAFHMASPNWDILDNLDQIATQFVVVSKKHFETLGEEEASKHPIGTGPFKFVEHKPGEYVKFEALDEHWRKVPDVRTLYIKRVPEMATTLAMYRTGEVDMFEVEPEFVPELLKVEGARTFNTSGRLFFLVLDGQYLPDRDGFDPTVPWVTHIDEPHDFNNPETMSEWNQRALKVRQALCYAINSQDINDYVINGLGSLTGQYPWFTDSEGWDPGWEPWPYDPGKAKQFLTEAGYEPGDISITIALVGFLESKPVMEAIGLMWEQIGINVEYETIDFGRVLDLGAKRQMAGYVWGGSTGHIHPATTISMHHMSTAYLNLGPEVPEIDQMVTDIFVELDDAKRVELCNELGWYMYNGRLNPGIVYTPTVVALGPKIKDWEASKVRARGFKDLEYVTLNR